MPPLLILCGGGHAYSVIDAMTPGDRKGSLVLDDNKALWGKDILGVPVFEGSIDEGLRHAKEHRIQLYLCALGSVRAGEERSVMFQRAGRLGFMPLERLIHPTARVSGSAWLGQGTVCLAGSLVGPKVWTESNVIINTGAVIEHHCWIGSHVHIASGAVLGGNVVVMDNSHIGLGATVLQGVKIGYGVTVGAGAVVIHDVPKWQTVIGVPARALELKCLKSE